MPDKEVCAASDDISERIKQQNGRLLTQFAAQQLEATAKKNWDLFYKRNENRFFKDRHWTTREFFEILSDDLNGAMVSAACSKPYQFVLEPPNHVTNYFSREVLDSVVHSWN